MTSKHASHVHRRTRSWACVLVGTGIVAGYLVTKASGLNGISPYLPYLLLLACPLLHFLLHGRHAGHTDTTKAPPETSVSNGDEPNFQHLEGTKS